MKFNHLKDLLECKTDELTLEDVEILKQTTFAEDVPVTFHGMQLNQQALIPFIEFISTLKCLYVTLYFENLDYQTARTICDHARTNPHALKMTLDLGEQILALISSQVLNNGQSQDICDYLISGVYKKLHTLIIEYRSINCLQAKSICKALCLAPLQSLEIACLSLDDETKDYFTGQLSTTAIPDKHLLIRGKEQLEQVGSKEHAAPAELDSNKASERSDDEDMNCLQKALTWMLSLASSNRTAPTNEQEPIRHHPKMH